MIGKSKSRHLWCQKLFADRRESFRPIDQNQSLSVFYLSNKKCECLLSCSCEIQLVSVENVVLREIIHSLVVYYFFYNFGDWPKIFRICHSTFFIQRFQLCYIIFRKMRGFDGCIVNLGYRHS